MKKETNSIVDEAKKRFARAEEAYGTTRKQGIEDTRFAMGDSDNGWQWPDSTLKARQADKKVCLTINLTAQHCNQIINQIRQNRPACRVMPVDNYADKKTAEIMAGLIRNIQTASAADDAHDSAAEHSIYGGEGFWRVVTEFESPSSFDQVIKIKSCPNPNLVFIDPDAKEMDKSDAAWGFVFEDINKETFKRENPDIDPADWEKEGNWVNDETFRLAEYFYCDYVKDKALLLSDGTSMLESKVLAQGVVRNGMTLTHAQTGESIDILKERNTERKQWKWCKLVGGHDKPLEERDWAGDYLPIVSVIGKELNVNGEIIRKGLVRDLKDPARMVNYAYSETVQTIALQNKVPYMASTEAIEGHEAEWETVNLDNLAYLPYNAYDGNGNALPMPSRQAPPTMATAQVQLLQLSTEEMRGVSGQQSSNFGIKSEASSGVGIQRLKQQGEIATFHFPDNLARGLRYEGKILIDLIQKVYDTKRIVRILGLDGSHEQATLDPEQQEAYSENDIGQEDVQKIFNPSLGQYDLVIDTGPSFQTQRQEGAAALNELASRAPNLMAVAGDLIMRAQDFPMAAQLADRLEKTLPPNLQEQKGGAEQQLSQAMQQVQQAEQHIEMMGQQMQELQERLQQAESGQMKVQTEIQAKMQLAEMDAQITEAKLQREMEFKRQQMAMEEQFAREKAELDAHLAAEKAQSDAQLKLQIAGMDIKSKEEIAELNAYVELQKVGKENPALTASVNKDVSSEEAKPKKRGRKKITMVAPSGASYTGTIEDDGGISMVAPSGAAYQGSIQEGE